MIIFVKRSAISLIAIMIIGHCDILLTMETLEMFREIAFSPLVLSILRKLPITTSTRNNSRYIFGTFFRLFFRFHEH